jgi:hypothetical protein
VEAYAVSAARAPVSIELGSAAARVPTQGRPEPRHALASRRESAHVGRQAGAKLYAVGDHALRDRWMLHHGSRMRSPQAATEFTVNPQGAGRPGVGEPMVNCCHPASKPMVCPGDFPWLHPCTTRGLHPQIMGKNHRWQLALPRVIHMSPQGIPLVYSHITVGK